MRTATLGLTLLLLLGLAACGGGTESGTTPAGEAAESGAGEEAAPPAGEVAESPVDPATAGTVSGKVSFSGTPPENEPIDMSGEPDCAAQYADSPAQETVLVNSDGTLQNAFVYVKSGLGDLTFPVPSEPVVLDQSGCRYHPHVLGIQVGQPLEIVNSDPVLHNIHPQPTENRAFNVSQPTQGMKSTKTFTKPEVMIPVGCDVHDWMSAHIGVLEHPYFAVTGEDGSFSLPNLPPGDYTLVVWHEQFGEQEEQVTVGPSETKTADFSYAGSTG